MLETTLSTTFTPGTNVKGTVAGANWTFLLPALELERIVCFGAPVSASLVTLARLSQEVMVICANDRQLRRVNKLTAKQGLAHIIPLVNSETVVTSLPEDSVDLILITAWSSLLQFYPYEMMLAELRRLLKPEGLLYFEFGNLVHRLPNRQTITDISEVFGASHLLWLTPLRGETATAVSLPDSTTRKYFLRHKLYSTSSSIHLLNRLEQFLAGHNLFKQFVQRYGTLAGPAAADLADHPPQYLRDLALSGRLNLDGYKWGLSARGKYNSRKVLFYLFNSDSGTPQYIVKMTRDATFNARLENEHRALTRLQTMDLADEEELPQSVFFGHHGGLAILGETIIEGVPFRQRTQRTPDCRFAQAAIDWLTNVGRASADTTLATSAKVARELKTLFLRFAELYCLSLDQFNFLHEQLVVIERNRGQFPLVLQHGDPGIWNMLVTRSGKVAFLDWEAAELHGMPLWDLFYFLRSYCTWVARSQGINDTLQGFAHLFLEDSPLSPLVIEATRQYCQQIQLPATLIEPLFYLCWVHRALKQATRLPLSKLEQGHYVNLLRLCIDRHDAHTLRYLFAG